MDPASILALVETCMTITVRVGTISNQLWSLKEKYKHVERKVAIFESQLGALSTAAIGISEWLQTSAAQDAPVRQELQKSLGSCDLVVQVIMEYLDNAQSQSNKMSLWSKTKFLRDEKTISEYEGMLRGQVQALSLLLQILTLPSKKEQADQIQSFETSSVLIHARDTSSSLLWLRDSESARTVTSTFTEDMETLDRKFDFDELIVTSKVYRSTLASFLKQKIKGEKRNKTKGSQGAVPVQQRFPHEQAQSQLEFLAAASSLKADPNTEAWIFQPPVTDSPWQPGSYLEQEPQRLQASDSRDTDNEVPDIIPKPLELISKFRPLTVEELDEIELEAVRTAHWTPHALTKEHIQTFNQLETVSQGRHETPATDKEENPATDKEKNPAPLQIENTTKTAETSSAGQRKADNDDDDDDNLSKISSSPSISDENIDFELVYALHTFVATVEGQVNATKGDAMVLLDDSNSYWWLVRVVKDNAIGYLPAEHVETPTERLSRLNKHRNIDLTDQKLGIKPEKVSQQLKLPILGDRLKNRKKRKVNFDAMLTFIDTPNYDDEETGDEPDDRKPVVADARGINVMAASPLEKLQRMTTIETPTEPLDPTPSSLVTSESPHTKQANVQVVAMGDFDWPWKSESTETSDPTANMLVEGSSTNFPSNANFF